MDRRTWRVAAVLVVALLTLGAGCSAIQGGGDGGATGGDAYTGANEALNVTELGADTAAIVSAADSYTLSVSFTVGNETKTPLVSNQTRYVDRENDRARSEATVKFFGERNRARYTEGDTTWQKVVADPDGDANTTYAKASAPYDGEIEPVNMSVPESIDAGMSAVTWERTAVETVDGTTLTHYEVDEVQNTTALPSAGLFGSGDTNLTNVRGSLVVTSDGLIREYTMAYDYETDKGETMTVRLHLEFSAINETSVSKPDWTSKA